MVFCFSGDGNPALAAKPGFHDQAPGGAEGVAVPYRHGFDIMPELLAHITENPLAGKTVQSEGTGRVVIDLAGGAVTEAAQAAVVEAMGGQFELDTDGEL